MSHLSVETKEWVDWAAKDQLERELSDELMCEDECAPASHIVAVSCTGVDHPNCLPHAKAAKGAVRDGKRSCIHCGRLLVECWSITPLGPS